MISTIKKQIAVTWRDWLVMSAILLGCAVFGKILFAITAYFDKETVSYFPLATVLISIVAVMYGGIMAAVQISMCFNIEVAMGCTRKHYFCSFYIASFVGNLISYVLILGVNVLENAMNKTLYPTWASEIDTLPYILKWGIPALVLVTIIGGLCGTLMMRFGKIAFWIMWAIWMIGCIGGPQISDAVEEAPDSVYGRIGLAIGAGLSLVPVNAWICVGVLAGVLSLAGAWFIIRKQQVTA